EAAGRKQPDSEAATRTDDARPDDIQADDIQPDAPKRPRHRRRRRKNPQDGPAEAPQGDGTER
ncbi:MAG: hypothetical protein Q4F29_13030, partial [Lachnospiraceae bacterium]|nr:hypothetical protein [Lachnospiraceae bacterium]